MSPKFCFWSIFSLPYNLLGQPWITISLITYHIYKNTLTVIYAFTRPIFNWFLEHLDLFLSAKIEPGSWRHSSSYHNHIHRALVSVGPELLSNCSFNFLSAPSVCFSKYATQCKHIFVAL